MNQQINKKRLQEQQPDDATAAKATNDAAASEEQNRKAATEEEQEKKDATDGEAKKKAAEEQAEAERKKKEAEEKAEERERLEKEAEQKNRKEAEAKQKVEEEKKKAAAAELEAQKQAAEEKTKKKQEAAATVTANPFGGGGFPSTAATGTTNNSPFGSGFGSNVKNPFGSEATSSTPTGSAFGSGGNTAFSSFGNKPSTFGGAFSSQQQPTTPQKNLFGATSPFGSPSTGSTPFGNGGRFAQTPKSLFAAAATTGSGFSSFRNKPVAPLQNTSSAFGGTSAFGGGSAFGSNISLFAAASGSTFGGGSAFGQATKSPFASATSNTTASTASAFGGGAGFSSFANKSGGFGALAQQATSNNPQNTSSFGSTSAFGSGGSAFGSQQLAAHQQHRENPFGPIAPPIPAPQPHKYTLNTRAPICIQCGNSFCTICIRKFIHGKLVCCCICLKNTFFGPNKLGKNIQLLDILEKMKLLDPDEKRNPFETSLPAEATSYPENIVEGIKDRDMYKFFEFCFDFVKKFYEEKQEKTLTNLAMYNDEIRFNEMTQHTVRIASSREQLATSMDLLLTKFDECLQTMKAVESGNNSIMPRISQMPESRSDEVFLDFNQMDPFGLEAHANSHIEFMENLNSSTPIGVFSFFDPDNSFSADMSFEDAPSINR